MHRDVKSDNCLLSHDLTGDRLILADFGLARADLLRPPPGHQSPLVGSIGYLAPERLHTRGDARTDVYAAGVVLFEALTRRLPFRGPQDEVLRQHAEDPPPCPSRLVDVPRGFDML
ncbi:MAG: protein kinase domain-containing protein, partial [Nannocystaceae bacterium]